MLATSSLVAGYGEKTVLREVSLEVAGGEMVALIGHNGAGKTTLLRTLMGLLPIRAGSLTLGGADVTSTSAARRRELGMAFVPETKGVFPGMSVERNLEMGAWGTSLSAAEKNERLAAVLDVFPTLKERLGIVAGVLSGGQRQMVAIGRALVARPSLLLLDEPTLGLAPVMAEAVLDAVAEARRLFRTTAIVVEQNVGLVVDIADRVVVLKTGSVAFSSARVDDLSKLWDYF